MTTINKDALAAIISKRLDGVIPKAIIYDAINVICDELSENLINRESVVISNFGILDTYTHHGHEGVNISSGEMNCIEPFINAKFIPHENLLTLLNRRKKKFKT